VAESFDDRVLLDGAVTAELKTIEAATNYVEERIRLLAEHIAHQPPPPTDIVSSTVAMHWRNRALISFGMASGALQALQAFNVISVEQFQKLKVKLLNVVSGRLARFSVAGE
jgi:hypothetical protein